MKQDLKMHKCAVCFFSSAEDYFNSLQQDITKITLLASALDAHAVSEMFLQDMDQTTGKIHFPK